MLKLIKPQKIANLISQISIQYVSIKKRKSDTLKETRTFNSVNYLYISYINKIIFFAFETYFIIKLTFAFSCFMIGPTINHCSIYMAQ